MDNSNLVHGVFNRQSDVLAAFKARCAAEGVDFGGFSWIGSEVAPDFDPNDPEVVVLLDATLGSLSETIDFAWRWGEAKHCYRHEQNPSENMDLIEGVEFKPWTLSWKRIKLDTHREGMVTDVKGSIAPGSVLFFLGAEHPQRFNMNNCPYQDEEHEYEYYIWQPHMLMAGIRLRYPNEKLVPYHASLVMDKGRVALCCYWWMGEINLTIPTLC